MSLRLNPSRGVSFREAERALEFVNSGLHSNVECRLVSCELRANHAGQSLNGGAQLDGIHLLQYDRNCDVEQFPLTFLKLLCPMGEQTTTQHSSKAHERPAFARAAFVTSAVADHLAIKAEDCVPEREDVFVWEVP